MITIFTGAGASRALGYPTTAEFFSHEIGQRLQKSEVYIQAKQYFRKSEVIDVEDLLRLLQPFVSLTTTPTWEFIHPSLPNHWCRQIPSFVTDINRACFDLYGSRVSKDDVRQAYMPLLNLFDWKNRRINLFTTNYDPSTDTLLTLADENNVKNHDGFGRLGMWDPEAYQNTESANLSIYRLHGSMSWVKQGNSILNTREYTARIPGHTEHLIIYPGFKGSPEEDDIHPAFTHAHSALREDLSACNLLIIIGFSFRDPYLNTIFMNCLKSNEKLNIVVLNPVKPECAESGLGDILRSFERRITFLPHRFGSREAIAEMKKILSRMNLRDKNG